MVSPHAAAGAAPWLTSGDGLGIGVGADGSVGGIGVDEHVLPLVAEGGGFSVRTAGGTPNLLGNPGFEVDADLNGMPDGWGPAPSGTVKPVLTTGAKHGGARSVRITNTSRQTSGGIQRAVTVRPLTDYTVSAWFRSYVVQPTAPTALSYDIPSPVRVVVQQLAGSTLIATRFIYGYTDTADWNRHFLGIRTGPTTTALRVRVVIVEGVDSAWFDDLQVSELFRPGTTVVRGAVTPTDEGLHQEAFIATEQLDLEADYTATADRITVHGTVTSRTSSNRAVEVSWTLPLDAAGWWWADHARQSRRITAGRQFSYQTAWNVQPMSRYPWNTIHGPLTGLSLAVPLDEPRVVRYAYGPQGFTVSFDLGVSRSATRLGPSADFTFVLYRSDPAWGFRAATERYYELFPEAFVRRTDPEREGIWFSRADLASLETSWQDFGLGLDMVALGAGNHGFDHTWGTAYLGWNNARDIHVTAYNHHWAYKLRLDGAGLQAYDATIARLTADATSSAADAASIRARDRAIATLHSAARDFNGRLLYERYAGASVQFYQDIDPDERVAMDWSRAVRLYQVQRALDLAAAHGGRLDALHFDSTSGQRRWAGTDDYHRAHWAVADVPLTFSYDSGLVVDRLIFPDLPPPHPDGGVRPRAGHDRVGELQRQRGASRVVDRRRPHRLLRHRAGPAGEVGRLRPPRHGRWLRALQAVACLPAADQHLRQRHRRTFDHAGPGAPAAGAGAVLRHLQRHREQRGVHAAAGSDLWPLHADSFGRSTRRAGSR